MHSSRKPTVVNCLFRSLLLAICISISFGNALRLLLPSSLTGSFFAANVGLLEEQPTAPSSSTEELPQSNESPEEGEAEALSLPKRPFKREHTYSTKLPKNLVRPSTAVTRDQVANGQIECNRRNGCGAHLRC